MLKNMKVGKRIAVGFGAVIALLAAVMLVSNFLSLKLANDLDRVGTLVSMRGDANNLIKNNQEAAAQAAIVFDALDSQEAYELCMADLEDGAAILDQMKGYSAQLSGYQESEIAQAESLLNQWQQSVTQVHGMNQEMATVREELITSSRTLAETSTELVASVSALTVQLSDDGDMEAATRRITNVILPSSLLSESIDAMRLDSANLILTFDTSVVESLFAQIDQIHADSEVIYNAVTTDEARAALTQIQQDLTAYSASLQTYVDTIHASDVVIDAAKATMEQATAQTTQMNDTIAAEVLSTLNALNQQATFTVIAMFAAMAIGVVIAIFIGLFLGRSVTKPLKRMEEFLQLVGETGEMDFTEEMRAGIDQYCEQKDEVGSSMKAFRTMILRLIEINEKLHMIANGDLRVEIDLLSERDSMGQSLQLMSNNLNEMFEEIHHVSGQVAVGSSEIAQSAQALAQGATEQASTVQQISATMVSISEQGGESLKTAREVAHSADLIRDKAIAGNQKMQDMTSAVSEIGEASESIGQVIKVIDDIAFQTNILALNAAVEAARAGEHGKGFAVVADEVRQLAGKSADAAKKTADLISANIEKTELGMRISNETAEALQEIVENIRDASEAMNLVATQAESTTEATAQVNEAIEQVAQVVQTNSATSEESAASSQQMSSQAQILRRLIAQFKLKNIQEDEPTQTAEIHELPPMDPSPGNTAEGF
ncbi:methyl-accepting chemotaxis protein [Ruminococcaceae bacterium OttesenSCG-928-I18]|nr:methyl-accepting chemotaxis protein [Ruminococcaceae bacterium OttesenSCG-928-I18]